MRGGFELADIGLTLCCICADRANRLQIACIHRIREIDRRSLRRNRLLALAYSEQEYPDICPVRGRLEV